MSKSYIGYCHMCKALCEFSDDRYCPRMRPSSSTHRLRLCGYRISLLWSNHPIAQAVVAAHKIGGWHAAVAVWEEAGRPELAYDSDAKVWVP